MIRLASEKAVFESLLLARMRIRRFRDVEMEQSSVKLSPEQERRLLILVPPVTLPGRGREGTIL